MNGNRSYNPKADTLPGVKPERRPSLKLVSQNDRPATEGVRD